MANRVPIPGQPDKRSEAPRLRDPESWRPFAAAQHGLSMGISKIVAAACGVGPSRWSAMCNGLEPSYGVQLCRAMDAALAEHQPAAAVFAELRLIASRYGFDLVPLSAKQGADGATCAASLAREAGELLAVAIERMKGDGITPEGLTRIEKEAQDVIEACHLLVRYAQSRAAQVKPRLVG